MNDNNLTQKELIKKIIDDASGAVAIRLCAIGVDLGIFENYKNSITLIEWPQLIDKVQLNKAIELNFIYENELNNRSVIINGLN